MLAHETGHAVHVTSGLESPKPEMLDELRRNYSTLATGDEYRNALVLPSSRNYTGAAIEHELIAEAFRAALTNPNYMKTVAPQTYATLRKWIKSNKDLAKLIQLNSLGAGVVAAAVGAGGQDDASAAVAPREQDSRARAHGLAKVAKALPPRRDYPKAPGNENFGDLVRALAHLDTRQKSQLYGGPR